MKTARAWWDETCEDPAWMDAQHEVIERIQRDAFLAGAEAGIAAAAKTCQTMVDHMPQQAALQASAVACHVLGINARAIVERQFPAQTTEPTPTT